jgi:hypothetical protein
VERGLAWGRRAFQGGKEVEFSLKLGWGEGREFAREAWSSEAKGGELGAHFGKGGGWNEQAAADGRDWIFRHRASLFDLMHSSTNT